MNKTECHKLNPLHSVLKTFDEDEFVVVKLDIDKASIEYPLAHQLLDDKDGFYHKLVDQFYFEHHVVLAGIAPWWADSTKGSVKVLSTYFMGFAKKVSQLIIGREVLKV